MKYYYISAALKSSFMCINKYTFYNQTKVLVTLLGHLFHDLGSEVSSISEADNNIKELKKKIYASLRLHIQHLSLIEKETC